MTDQISLLTFVGCAWITIAGVIVLVLHRRLDTWYRRIRRIELTSHDERPAESPSLALGVSFLLGGVTGISAILMPGSAPLILAIGALIFLVAVSWFFTLALR